MRRPARIWRRRRWWVHQRIARVFDALFRGCVNFDNHPTWRDA